MRVCVCVCIYIYTYIHIMPIKVPAKGLAERDLLGSYEALGRRGKQIHPTPNILYHNII